MSLKDPLLCELNDLNVLMTLIARPFKFNKKEKENFIAKAMCYGISTF